MEAYRGSENLHAFDYHGDLIKSLVYFTYSLHAGDRLEVDPTPDTYENASKCMHRSVTAADFADLANSTQNRVPRARTPGWREDGGNPDL